LIEALVLQLAGCTGKHFMDRLDRALEVFLTNKRFAYAILAADELVAVTNAVKFHYDDGKTFLRWVVGEEVDPAVWMSLFLILVTIINMLPVKVRIDLASCLPPRYKGSGNTC
jgi:amino acid permease